MKVYSDVFEFTRSKDDLHRQYKQLAMKYHPDRDIGSDDAFKLIKKFYQDALSVLENDETWIGSDHIVIELNGKDFKFNYRFGQSSEFGKTFSGNENVLFLFDKGNEDLLENGVSNITRIRKKNDKKILDKYDALIPSFRPEKSKNVVVSKKQRAFHPLRLVLNHYPIGPKHLAWMIGRLIDFLNFLEWSETVHGAISVDNIWVDLDRHVFAFFGGWCYSRQQGQKLIALPRSSSKFVKGNVAEYSLDRDCARQTIFDIIGVKSLASLRMRKEIPSRIIDFLSSPFRQSSAYEVYRDWERVRDESFGERKFIKFEYNVNSLYNQQPEK